MEPSIRCGGVAKHGTDLHCVACKERMYSDTYGKDQCRPCSLCSEGGSFKRNCSASQNRLCGSCNYGYYMNDVVSSCLPCSICCWDGKDQLESQCIDQGLPSHRHCKPRHKDGCELWTTAALSKEGTNTRGRIVITSPTTMKRTIYPRKTSRLKISSTVQHNSTQIQVNKSTVPFQSLSTERRQPAVEVTKGKPTPTTPLNRHPRRKNRKNTASTSRVVSHGKTKRSVSESTENKGRIIIAVVVSMVVLILLAVIIKRNTVGNYLRWMKCRPACKSRDSELGECTESTSLGEINGVQGGKCNFPYVISSIVSF